ncbi:MAG: DUF4321 domain-containing protein [Candidatus Marinimicrobia bacterium]|nr:DUF4321 domain-containing protein [Candidatus Neomarinimicrobiota bacterium]MBL7059393.1 DUF4321 domain-containing protein [Candidatus Neomarinimicrobiota bacterium]
MKRRSITLVVFGFSIGAMIGTLVGEFLGFILPDGVVKEFFLTSIQFDLAGLVGNESGVIVLNLIVVTLKFGLTLVLNFTSIIGLGIAYYFLRYFR